MKCETEERIACAAYGAASLFPNAIQMPFSATPDRVHAEQKPSTPRILNRLILMLLAAVIAVSSAAAAGLSTAAAASNDSPAWTTGKIAGNVTDAATGEPLPGATVRIEDTTLGAAAAADGYYNIINVTPGTYTLVVSMIGYATTRIENVEVSVDRTTRIDVELQEEVIEGEEVIVIARRPLIEVDRTTSASYVNSESISNLPVQEMQDLLQLQPGVAYDASGRLHLRGGRHGEVAYMVDGIPVTDQFSGGSKIEIENSWIQELQVISGTFNAEYGQAQSGVINVITKEGDTQEYSGSASFFTGSYLSSNESIFQNATTPEPDQFNGELSVGGPIPLIPGGSFFVNGRYFRSDGWLYGERRTRIEDTVPIQAYIHEVQQQASDIETLVGIEVPDSLQTGDGELVSMNPSEKYSLHGTFAARPFNNVKLSYSAFLNDQERKSYSDSRRYAPDGQPTHYEQSQNHILSFTHTVTPSTFYRIAASYQNNTRESYLFENPLDSRYQGGAHSVEGFLFGGTSNGRSRSVQDTYLGKVDLTTQINRYNLVKLGTELRRHHIEYRDLSTVSDGAVYEPPELRLPPPNTAGNDFYTQDPLEFAAYVQDKVEIDEIILNAGLRFDYWNPNALIPADLEATTDPNDGIRLDTDFIDSEVSTQLSPRVGLAFPISQGGVLHVSYGHFFQIPRFSYVFTNSEFEVRLGDLETIMGNANLKPEKTVAYEIGLQQALTRDWKVELTVYYKDIKNLLGQEIITTRDKKIYARYINRDYGNTRGFVLSLIRQYLGNFGATVDYTYQIARGNASDPNAVFFDHQTNPPRESEKQVLPLDWDQRHALNGTLIIGNASDWTLSLIGRFHTGQPYTPSNPGSALAEQFENSERKPTQLSLDVNFIKRFQIAGQGVKLFARAYNVLDQLNARSVYTSTGRADRPFRTIGETEVLLQNPNFSIDEIDLRPDFYTEPRRVIAGIELTF